MAGIITEQNLAAANSVRAAALALNSELEKAAFEGLDVTINILSRSYVGRTQVDRKSIDVIITTRV
jgi:hypothetical protein